jgi:carbon-monoxide dehydrogenase medium subunit
MGTTRVLRKFEYFKPKSIYEALSMLDEFGYGVHLIAGGTNILVDIKHSKLEPKVLVDISEIDELKGIRFNDRELIIGAATTIDEIEKSEVIKNKYTALFEAAQVMGSTQIKNSATIAGNICNASPAADSVLPLIVFNAEIEIVNSKETKKVSINDFFTGYKRTIIKPGDILKSIILQNHQENTGSAFVRITRTASDLSQVNASALVTLNNDVCKELRVAVGAVNVYPIRAVNVENMLRGKKINEKLIKEAANAIIDEINPIDDVRASAEYRRDVSIILVQKALLKAYEQSKKKVRG